MQKLTGEFIVTALETTEGKIAFYNKLKEEISPVDAAGKPKRVVRKNLSPILVKLLLADVFRGEGTGGTMTEEKREALFGLLTVALRQGVIKPKEAFGLVVPREQISGMPSEQALRQKLIGVLLDGCPAALKEQKTILQDLWVDITSDDDNMWRFVGDAPLQNMVKAIKQGLVTEEELYFPPCNSRKTNMRRTGIFLDCQTDAADKLIEDRELIRGILAYVFHDEDEANRAVGRETLAKALAYEKTSVKDVVLWWKTTVRNPDRKLVRQEVIGMLLEHKPHELKAEMPDFLHQIWMSFKQVGSVDGDERFAATQNMWRAFNVKDLVSEDAVCDCLGDQASRGPRQDLIHIVLEKVSADKIASFMAGHGNIRIMQDIFACGDEAASAVAFENMKTALSKGAMDPAYAVNKLTQVAMSDPNSEGKRLKILEAIYEIEPSIAVNEAFQDKVVSGMTYRTGAERDRYSHLFALAYFEATRKPKRRKQAVKATKKPAPVQGS